MALVFWMLKKTVLWTIYLLITLTFLIYAPFLLDFKPNSYNVALPKTFSGPLKENDLLSKTQKLFVGEAKQPESLALYKGDVYTALSDGRVIRIRNDKFTVVADVSEGQCEGLWEMAKCGRPLGVKFDSKGYLYVVDAYFGLKRVDIPSGKGTVTTVLSSKTKFDGKAPIFLDDVVVVEGVGSKGGNVYYLSDGSAKWAVEDVVYSFAEHDKTGRLLRYDEDSKTATVVASDLAFPNGLELTDAKDAILMSEFNARRILKHYIKGSKAGKTEPFIENLPGEPDNIHRASDPNKETYWVALAFGRSSTNPDELDILSDKPFLRKAVFRLMHTIGHGIQYIGTVSDYIPLKDIGFKIKSGGLYLSMFKKRGLMIEIDANGKILRSLHSPDGHIYMSSEAQEVMEGNKKVLYIGSYLHNYVGKLVIN